MIATLQIHYGGDPMAWLRMPRSVLDAYCRMLPRVVARTSLRRVSETAAGSGAMRPGDQKDMLRAWTKEARERPSGQISRPSREDKHAALQAMGIEVEERSGG